MKNNYITETVERQRRFFKSGKTMKISFRKEMLMKLKTALKENETAILKGLNADLNKSGTEAYMTEIGIVLEELNYHIKHIHSWAKPKRVHTPVAHFPSKSVIYPKPYGVALIISPWNYPLNLSLLPLIAAISAGCTAVLKPSEYAPNTSGVLKNLLSSVFDPDFITVIECSGNENKKLSEENFDYIFFTGSKEVGREIMKKAAENLTPVTLELGGKSPCIISSSADVKLAAKRICFGKTLNSGQTCVAPDYVLIDGKLKEEFIDAYRDSLNIFFPNGNYSDMCSIINKKHFHRALGLLSSGAIRLGGGFDEDRLMIEPTILDDVGVDSPVMTEEIFAPILPILTYNSINTAIDFINDNPSPLALYYFGKDKYERENVINSCRFGGCCINDTVIHITNPRLPFGGIGESGIGAYHGKTGFDTFSHYTSIVKHSLHPDLSIRYRPYTNFKKKIIRRLMK